MFVLLFIILLSTYLTGEPIELRQRLLGYGIPVDMLPLTHTGTLKFKYHSQWISFRPTRLILKQEELPYALQSSTAYNNRNTIRNNNNARKLLVECPGSYDVIFRKGATCLNNPGNVVFNNLIEETYFQHIGAETRNQQKIKLIWDVIETIELNRGRLLEWDKHLNGWALIKDRSIVRNKVAYVFKELRRKYKSKIT